MTTSSIRGDAVNPPIPTSQQQQQFLGTPGQRLLSLIKMYDKQKQNLLNDNGHENMNNTNNDEYEVLEEIVSIIQQLTTVVQRQGLLRRNTAMAKRILDSTAITKQQQHQNGNKKKRRNFTLPQQQVLLDDTVGIGSTTATTTTTEDAQLLMMAIQRIIENHHVHEDSMIIYMATTDFITTSCQYIIQQQQMIGNSHHMDVCFLAEYELIASSSKALLNGMEQYLRPRITQDSSMNEIKLQGHHHHQQQQQQQINNYSVGSSFRAVTSIVALLGNKLFTSRSSSNNTTATTLQKIQELAWNILLTLHQHGDTSSASIVLIQKAATTFVATLPYAVATPSGAPPTTGTTNNTAGSMSWNQTWLDATTALTYTMQHVRIDKNNHRNEVVTDTMTDFVKQITLRQLKPTQQNNDENDRVHPFLQIVQNLVAILVALLTNEGSTTPSSSFSGNANCEINIDMLLNIIEGMLALPSTAENKYYSTKKRLRHESMTSGSLFSPHCIVTKIALPMRLFGHELFNTTITSLGSMNLLPFVRRVIKIIYQTIVSSSSMTVRHVTDPTTKLMFGLDPNSGSSTNKRGERWLHTSVVARTASIESFQYCVQTFGIDIQQLTSSGSSNLIISNRSNHVESSICIICATIIEELTVASSPNDNDNADNDWGTWNDHVQLVSTIVLSLTACLNCGGSFLSPTIRGLIDLVSTTSLSSIAYNHPLTKYREIKCSIIQLGSAVLCTPWQDGATSMITTELIYAAQSSVQDSNEAVVAIATMALNVCSALHCSRVPPLHVITRSTNFSNGNLSSLNAITAETIEEKLCATRDEMMKVKAVSNENAAARISKKSKPDSSSDQTHLQSTSTTANPLTITPTITSPQLEMDVAKKGLIDSGEVAIPSSPASAAENHNDPVDVIQEETMPSLLDPSTNVDDEDFPMIVDCGPDEDDEEER